MSRTLGAGSGSTTSYAYYAAAEQPPAACPGAAADQAKALKSTTGATPAAGAALVRNFTYDSAGRVVGSATAGNWTCTDYDDRGRVELMSFPSYGGEPARTVAINYKVNNNPFDTMATETIQSTPTQQQWTMKTTVDLLGRVRSYTDKWTQTTTSTYDQAGRLTDTSGPAGAFHVDYTAAGRVDIQSSTEPRWPTPPTTPRPAN